MRGWKRVKDCALCASQRCVVRADREDMGYCYRYQTTFFVKKDGRVITAKGTHTGIVLGRGLGKHFYQKGCPNYDWPMQSPKEELPLWQELI